jgi:hypothetical protein
MRDYGKISPCFWTGETGKRIREAGRDAQILAIYLVTCPSSNMIGLYYLPLPTLMHEVGIDQKGALKGLASLSEALFAHYDADSEHVFVPEMAAHQIGEPLSSSDNRVKGVVREWISMRKSPFFMDFHQRYATSFHLPNPEDMNIHIKAPCKPLRSQEQEQEQEQDISPKPPLAPQEGNGQPERKTRKKRDRLVIPYSPDFETWWKVFPNIRKTDKPEAFTIWGEAVQAVALERMCDIQDAVAYLIRRTTEYSASEQGKSKWCRGPCPWLNQAAWNDPPETWLDRNRDRPLFQASEPAVNIQARQQAEFGGKFSPMFAHLEGQQNGNP